MVKCKMIIVMIPLINLVVVESEGLPHLASYMDLWDAQVGQELATVEV